MKNKIEIVHSGCDGLTVALKGNLPQKTLDRLDAAKIVSGELGVDSLMTVNGLSVNVLEKGTSAMQGYAFQFHTGRFGIKYQAKRSLDASQWNLRARVSAMYLAQNGLKAAHNTIYSDLQTLGAVIIEDSVSNVDFCVDMKMDKEGTKRNKAFQLDPAAFVHHSKATKRQWYSENEKDSDCLSVFGNRYIETVTIGGRSNRQLCVYNKYAEQRSKRRSEWFEFWGEEIETCANIWRVEYRFGRDFLRDWNIKTIEDLEACYGRLIEDSLKRIRYVMLGNDSNLSRAKNHPFWDAVISAFADMVLTCEIDGLERGKITRAARADLKEIYEAQIAGLSAGLSHILEFESEAEAAREMPFIISELLKKHVTYKPDKFKEGRERAKAKMYFLRELENA